MPGWFLASLCLLCSEKLPANLCLPRQSRLLLSCPYLQESLLITACVFSKTNCLDPCWHPGTGRWYLVLGSYFTSLQTAWEPFDPTPQWVLTTHHQTLCNLVELKGRHSQANLHWFFWVLPQTLPNWKHPPSPEATQGKMSWLRRWLSWHLITHVPFPAQAQEPSLSASEGTVFLCQATRITLWVGDCA